MNKFIKIFIPILLIFLLMGINITVSKYVLTSSYSINVVLKLDEEDNSNELTIEKNVNENNTIESLPIEDNITHSEEVLICE